MSRAHTELHYHLVWSTWGRHPFLEEQHQESLYRHVISKCREYGYDLHAVNGGSDHMHVALRLKPTVSVSEAARKLKGSASRFCNRELHLETVFRWQGGYGALTFGTRDLPKVVAYVRAQKERHRSQRLDETLEAIGEG
jgi:REP element-mobilizing transposase RayT